MYLPSHIYSLPFSVIAANMPRLRPPPNIRHCTTVNDWLQSLHLTSLEYYFEGYSLEKISQLWEMQLLNVTTLLYIAITV